MSVAREIKRCVSIAQLVRENACEIVSALYATDQAYLAQCLTAELGLADEDVLDGPRPPVQPPAVTAAAALRAKVLAELAKHGLTAADIEKIRAVRAAEAERKRARVREGRELRKAEELERKSRAS